MKTIGRYAITALICFAAAASLGALGGGGAFYGTNSAIGNRYSTADFTPMSIQMTGGYGYGVDWDGTKIGGFGMSFNESGSDSPAGGFGGMIFGSYSRLGPFSFSGNALLGVGGLSWPQYFPPEGGVALMTQVDVELGFPIVPWFQVSAYGGMQFLMPLSDRSDRIMRYPVMGLRFTWGDF